MLEFTYSLVNFEYFLLILARVASFFAVAPFFRLQGVPTRTKAGLSAIIALFVYEQIPRMGLVYGGVMEYAVLVGKEVLTGLCMGFALYVCDAIIPFAGHLIDLYMGFSMAQEYNPMTQSENSVTGTMYDNLIMLMLLVGGMYQYIVRAIIDVFELIPVAGTTFYWDGLMKSFVTFMTNLFILGFRISLPIFACMLVLNSVLGIMAKVAPQMNMFAVGMQIKLTVGLSVIMLTVFLLPKVAEILSGEMKELLVSVIKAMLPVG